MCAKFAAAAQKKHEAAAGAARRENNIKWVGMASGRVAFKFKMKPIMIHFNET